MYYYLKFMDLFMRIVNNTKFTVKAKSAPSIDTTMSTGDKNHLC